MLAAEDSQGNTIAHLVATSGNTEVFEVHIQYMCNVMGTYPIHLRTFIDCSFWHVCNNFLMFHMFPPQNINSYDTLSSLQIGIAL